MAEFVGIGDLHLTDATGSGGLSKYVKDADDMVVSEVQKVVDWATNKGIDKVIQYGDVCDGPRMSYSGTIALIGLIEKNPDTTFYFILGNHDLYGKTTALGHSLELMVLLCKSPNVKFITKPKTLNVDGVKVRFLPYPHESFDRDALNVFHKEVRGSKNDHGRVNDSDDLPKSHAVIVAGHLHTAHQVRNTFYSGTLLQNNFGESLPKYFHHIEFNSKDDFNIQLIKHKPTHKLHNIVLQTRADLALIPKGDTNLVKLVIQDGADVSAVDYGKFTNIAMVKPFKSKEDLQVVLTEDLTEGKELIIRTEDFFKVWVASLDVDPEMRKRVRSVRKRVLENVN